MQKIIYVSNGVNGKGLENANEHLQNGWKVVSITPMSGSGDSSINTALIVIEK